MYIWTGCKLPEEFETEIRARCLPLGEALGLNTSGFTLPQHISLKISFEAGERYPEILDYIEGLLRREAPFSVIPVGIEQHGGILWITFRENEILRRLHNTLDGELEARFGIRQHMFDKEYYFHSALFTGDPEKIAQAYTKLKDFPLPGQLRIDTFLQGVSAEGTSGTFRVVRSIQI